MDPVNNAFINLYKSIVLHLESGDRLYAALGRATALKKENPNNPLLAELLRIIPDLEEQYKASQAQLTENRKIYDFLLIERNAAAT